MKFDKTEKDLLESYENDEWLEVADVQAELDRYKRYAEATFKKEKRINIRLSKQDLDALQAKALREGMPYQTLISSVLHKYVDGRFMEKAG